MLPSDETSRARLLERSALVLNRSWMPVHVTPVRRALCLLIRRCARVVDASSLATFSFEEWVDQVDGVAVAYVRSPSLRIPVPEVIVLSTYDRLPAHEAPFTRRNLFLRDDYTCQYCARRCSPDALSIDHVLPRSRGGATSWENCVLACKRCNARKANRTPREVGLQLLQPPRRPRWTPGFNLRNSHRLPSWEQFVPKSAGAVGHRH
jgi:5-methylcytosine-specific restriction endonuclease McrA